MTPSVVLRVRMRKERSKAVNEQRLARRTGSRHTTRGRRRGPQPNADQDGDQEELYEPGNWENLVFRYEEPNPMTRWDSPLFTIIWEDDEAQARDTFGRIWDAFAGDGRKVVKPNLAAVQRDKDPGGDYLCTCSTARHKTS